MSSIHKEAVFEKAAQQVIRHLEKRHIRGHYYANSAECVDSILKLIPDSASIAWGGSETLNECGLMDALHAGHYQLIDRSLAKNPQEASDIYAKTVTADYYFMSSNAITLAGELVNIDGSGNRLACLLHGPKQVFLIIGRNKLVSDVEEGYKRIKNLAAPANTQRLQRKTPCRETGSCMNCFSPDCVCSHTVITRRCSQPDRLTVFLVNEELGY